MKLLPLYFACLVASLMGADGSVGKMAARPVLPENVERRAVSIFSDGVRMAGDLYLPKGLRSGEKLPAIVCCNGTGGTKGGTAARLGPDARGRGFHRARLRLPRVGRERQQVDHVVKGITHYGIYREGFDEATRLELAWFKQHLKPPAAASAR